MADMAGCDCNCTPGPPTLSRRGFFRAAAALGGAVALGSVAGTKNALAVEDFDGRPDRFGMLTDMTKCVGCRMCEQACAKANNLPTPPSDPAVMDTPRRPSAQAFTVVTPAMKSQSGNISAVAHSAVPTAPRTPKFSAA